MAPNPRADADRKRLRDEIDDLSREIEAVRASQAASDLNLVRLSSSPLDVDKIRFPARVVVAIVGAIMSIVLGMYASTYGLRSDVRDILTRIDQQEKVEVEKEKLTIEKQKLADERLQALRNAVDMIDKRQQLLAIENQELKEMVLQTRRQP